MAESKLSEKIDNQRREHASFSTEVMLFLMNNSGLKMYEIKNYEYFTADIGEAILTISNIFHKDFRKICHQLSISLKNIEKFKEYCELITVNKNDLYFFYFLRRISLIYELAMFCYVNKYSKKEEYKYFESGCSCIENCPDIQTFYSMGGWINLQRTALLLANIGRPLKLIMLQKYVEDESILTFVDVVEKLHADHLYSGNLKMLDSQEMACLENLRALFKENVLKTEIRKKLRIDDSLKLSPSTTPIKDVVKNEGIILRDYFKYCLCKFQGSEDWISLYDKEFHPKSPEKSLGIEEMEQEVIDFLFTRKAEMADKLSNTESHNALVGSYESRQQRIDVTTETSKQDNVRNDELVTSLEVSDCMYEGGRDPESKDNEISAKLSRIFTESCSVEGEKLMTFQSEINHSFSSDESDRSLRTKRAKIDRASFSRMEGSKSITSFPTLHYEKDVTETGCCSTVNEESRIKSNFIVPQSYMNCIGNSDFSKYLYQMSVLPSSKREKLDELLKTILDENIINRNYKPLASGDIFVCPPGSSQKAETLVIFVDSSTDDESDDEIKEETYSLICRFKQSDINFEEQSYNLRRRELASGNKRYFKEALSDTDGKTQKSYDTGAMVKTSLRSKIGAKAFPRHQAVYANYLTKLYKKHILELLNKFLPKVLSKPMQNMVSFKSNDSSKKYEISHTRIINFMITARILAKRKVELLESGKSESMLCLSLTKFDTDPRILSSSEQELLDSYIKSGAYYSMDSKGSIYLVGPKPNDYNKFYEDVDCWLLFSAVDTKSNPDEYNAEMLEVISLYRQALLRWGDFPDVFNKYLLIMESELRHNKIIL